MLSRLLRYLLVPLFALGGIISFTWSDLMFQVRPPTPLAKEDLNTLDKIDYNRNYILEQPMIFKLPVSNEEGTKKATLLWSDAPFNKLAILVASQDESLDKQTRFEGRLVRCPGQCQTSDMLVDMMVFADKITFWFPEYVDHYSELPSILMDTAQIPGGWKGYLLKNKRPFQFLCVILVLCVIFAFSGSVLPRRFRTQQNPAPLAAPKPARHKPNLHAVPKPDETDNAKTRLDDL